MSRKMALLFSLIGLAVGAGLGYAAAHKAHGILLPLDEVEWVVREGPDWVSPDGSPISVAVLWGDPSTGAHGRLVKLPAGFVVANHAHTGAYHGFNLRGTWRHTLLETGQSRDLPPGSYVHQPGGEMHGDACVGSTDCVLLLVQDRAYDFIKQE